MVRLDTETKLITHAIRMAAFNAEVMLARALHGHYARVGDEAAALIREALTAAGAAVLHAPVGDVTPAGTAAGGAYPRIPSSGVDPGCSGHRQTTNQDELVELRS